MIYDVLSHLDARARDLATGLAARIVEVDALKGTETPPPEAFYVWTDHLLPGEMQLPAVQIVWEDSGTLPGRSQSVWSADWRCSVHWWLEAAEAEEVRKHLAIYAHATRLWLEGLPATGTIGELLDVSMASSGWRMAGRTFTWLGVGFTVSERDDVPI